MSPDINAIIDKGYRPIEAVKAKEPIKAVDGQLPLIPLMHFTPLPHSFTSTCLSVAHKAPAFRLWYQARLLSEQFP